VITTNHSIWLNNLLDSIWPTLFKIWAKNVKIFPNGRTSTPWFIKNTVGCIDKIKTWNKATTLADHNNVQSPCNVSTHDFEQLYTNIPQSDICNHIFKALDLFFDESVLKGPWVHLIQKGAHSWVQDSHIRFSNSGNRILRGHEFGQEFWITNKANARALVDTVINNAFIMPMVGEIYRQTKGIPMGGNAAPNIANMVLYMTELEYIERLAHVYKIKKATIMRNDWDKLSNVKSVARQLFEMNKFNCRFIDDLFTINNPGLTSEVNLEFMRKQ